MDDLTPAYLGARLARMRFQLGQSRREDITQRRLAHALDVKPQAYNSWEQGKALPRLDHLWRLARYYRVSLDRLCGYERDAEATQDPVDMAGILHQTLHLAAHRAELGDGQLSQVGLELGELLAGELGDHRVLYPAVADPRGAQRGALRRWRGIQSRRQ